MGKIELQNICFQYAGNSSMTLENINLSVNAGEFVCVLGTSGCGKSTLLSILCGLQRPSSGKFLIDGKEITGPGPERGVVFQHYSLFPWLTAKENIIFGIKQVRKDLPKKEIENIAQAYMAKVGLEDFESNKPAQLSGGQQQRVAIARALAMSAEILLLDEPFGAVDTKNRRTLQKLVCDLHESEKKTFIFVTHDVEEAILLADRIVFMIPHQIYQVIDVNLPKPREYEQIRNASDFVALRKMLIDLFYEKYKDFSYESAEAKL